LEASLYLVSVGSFITISLKKKKKQELLSTRQNLKKITSKQKIKKIPRDLSVKPSRCLGVLIAGPPGAGKGTQCELIIKRLGYSHISTGDLLRAAVKEGTELGLQAKQYMENGKLVPDDLVIGLVQEKLSNPDVNKNGWLLDGFPRTPGQAEMMKLNHIIPDKLILLDAPDEILTERITGRRMDPVDNKIYHIVNNPAPKEIEHRLIIRKDDTIEKLKVRLEEYHNNIQLIRDFYGDSLKIEIINALRPIEEVYSDVAFALIYK